MRSFAILTAIAAVVALAAAPASAQRNVPQIELDGTIDPASAAWIEKALEDAAEDGAPFAIVRLDTPGGLDTSMREIVQRIIAAPMPVVVWVAPRGARAASAGLFVTLAGDVAAMAPQTNIGAATPVSLSGGDTDDVLGRKVRNDAAAYVRALAEGHDRNADLAESMVREAVSVSASRARERGLIDVVAADREELLTALDGRRLAGPKDGPLETDGVTVEPRDMPLHYELRQLLVNPTVAYLLLTGGVLLIVFELLSPGLVGPGLFGAIALVFGLYGTAQLPVTVAGVALLALGFGLLIAETQVPSFGVLGAAGIVGIVAGGLLLFDTDSPALDLSVPVAIAVGVALGGFVLLAASKAVAARAQPPHGGPDDLIGRVATVRVPLDPVGQVYVEGALWRARPAEGLRAPVPPDTRVRVEAVDGLTLTVGSIDDGPPPKEQSP